MPNIFCVQCKTLEKVSTKNWNLYSSHDFDQVCSIDCLLTWIVTSNRCHTQEFKYVPSRKDMCVGHVHSGFTKSWFRSVYEKDTAEFFYRHNKHFLYEPAQFRVGKSIYIPDFYLPTCDSFVEVKGNWGASAKTKYRNFTKLFPDVRILLLDWRHHKTIKER